MEIGLHYLSTKREIPLLDSMIGDLVKEINRGGNSLVEHVDVEMFIGAMRIIGVQAKAHQNYRQMEYLLEVGDDGYAAAFAHKHRRFAPSLLIGSYSRLQRR